MLVGAMLQYPCTCCYSKQKMTLLGHSTLCIISYRKSYISYAIPNWNNIIYFCIFMSEYVKQQWLIILTHFKPSCNIWNLNSGCHHSSVHMQILSGCMCDKYPASFVWHFIWKLSLRLEKYLNVLLYFVMDFLLKSKQCLMIRLHLKAKINFWSQSFHFYICLLSLSCHHCPSCCHCYQLQEHNW